MPSPGTILSRLTGGQLPTNIQNLLNNRTTISPQRIAELQAQNAQWVAQQTSKFNAQQTKQVQGNQSPLPGSGGIMPSTPTATIPGFNFNPTINLPGVPSSGLSAGDIAGGIAAATNGCEGLPSPLKELCKGAGVVFGGPKAVPQETKGTTVQQAGCPAGTVRVGNTCISPGDVFPGGDPFLMEAGGQAVIGAFGLPAASPTIVGSINGNPIRRCGRGMVLGFDNLCYPKQLLGRRSRFRKHRGQAKPPMSAADAKALRRIGTLKKRVKELAGDAGLSCSTRSYRRK